MNLEFLKSAHGQEPVILEAEFKASPERLFRAWTTPEEVVAWFGSDDNRLAHAHIDLRKGGLWEFAYPELDGAGDVLRGEYVEIKPNVQLIFTWQHERKTAGGQIERTTPSLVTVSFEEMKHGVRLHLRHEQIVKESGRLGVGEGWNNAFRNLEQIIGA